MTPTVALGCLAQAQGLKHLVEWLLRFVFCLHAWCLSILWPFHWAHYFLTWDRWILNNHAAQARFIAWCVLLLICFFIHESWCSFSGDLNPLSAALCPLSSEPVTCTVHCFLVVCFFLSFTWKLLLTAVQWGWKHLQVGNTKPYQNTEAVLNTNYIGFCAHQCTDEGTGRGEILWTVSFQRVGDWVEHRTPVSWLLFYLSCFYFANKNACVHWCNMESQG